ncbi:MAG TPA: pyridoxal phosphate-dependent aminotransferase [Actinomycetota bacterium]|nr:pyridoxal phosphate-dependent aminotransferase [Actinomycetota bacterium]
MTVQRLTEIPGFNIDRVAAAAGDDPEVLRLENLDTDLSPPPGVIEATRAAVGEDDANSWLPFDGKLEMKEAVAAHIQRRSGVQYDPLREVVITGGEGDAMLNPLFVTTDPGDEVILTDPTYAGMLNRVRLAGAVPRLVPLVPGDAGWRLDLEALRATASPRTRAVFIMNPSLPTGCVMNEEEWEAVAAVCRERDAWLIYVAIYEGIVFDGLPVVHPASLEGMRDRVITAGSVSLEQRMIGWRIGWAVGPEGLHSDLSVVHIYNGLVPSGICQAGARVALGAPPEDLEAAVAEYQRRRDVTMEQLAPYSPVPAAGGWSFLVNVSRLGLDGAEASRRLLEQKVAATPMKGWGGEVAEPYVRFVFSNEPVERLELLGERAGAALGSS